MERSRRLRMLKALEQVSAALKGKDNPDLRGGVAQYVAKARKEHETHSERVMKRC